jgi:hypothetical protein
MLADSAVDWLDVPADALSFLDAFSADGWGDGLPVVPPTQERIEAHLETVAVDADHVFGSMPPGQGQVTAAKVAANAVLAGCAPETFPIVLTATIAMLTARFNLNGLQTTTHPVAPLLIVSGPVVARLGVNAGAGCFGPGTRFNATVGRALRLVLLHIGYARHGERDRATQGQPSKYAFCIGENSDESPWAPYSEAYAGLEAGADAVTLFGGENPHNVNDHVSTSADGVLDSVAAVIANPASNPAHYTQGEIFVVLSPEHAATVAKGGFDRADVQAYLFERARLPLRRLRRGGMWGMQAWPPWMEAIADPDALIPPVRSPDGFRVLVSGGPGKHSSVLPGFGASNCVTRRIGDFDRGDETA